MLQINPLFFSRAKGVPLGQRLADLSAEFRGRFLSKPFAIQHNSATSSAFILEHEVKICENLFE